MNRSCLYTSAAPYVMRDFHSREHISVTTPSFLHLWFHPDLSGLLYVRGALQRPGSRWKLSVLSSPITSFEFPVLFTPSPRRSLFFFFFLACRRPMPYVGPRYTARSRFLHVWRREREHVHFAIDTGKSQVVMRVSDCGWLQITWTQARRTQHLLCKPLTLRHEGVN